MRTGLFSWLILAIPLHCTALDTAHEAQSLPRGVPLLLYCGEYSVPAQFQAHCGTRVYVTTGNSRKDRTGDPLVELQSGEQTITVPISLLGPPHTEDPRSAGKAFSVKGVGFGDWLMLRRAPSPHSEPLFGIPRLQDNLAATGKTAQWKGKPWLEVSFSIRQAKRTGWVNAEYLKGSVEPNFGWDISKLPSGFVGELQITPTREAGHMRLLKPFAFKASDGNAWTVPSGYVTDGASIPRPLWSVVGSPYTGLYLSGAVIHDF